MTTPASPIVALVVAIAENGVIGRDGGLPWRMPSDLKLFRRTTMGKPLIMGRRTFASLRKPLDGRDNIVVSRDPAFAAEGALSAPDLVAALEIARECARARAVDEIMVIGGAEIFAAALPLARRLYLTRVHGRPEGDVRFPLADFSGWHEVCREAGTRSDRDEYEFTFFVLDRV